MANKKKTIDEVWLYVCDDEEGEGMPAQAIGDWFSPLMGADEARAKSLEPLAANIAAKSGQPVKLIKFTKREDIKIIEPKDSGKPSITMEEILEHRAKERQNRYADCHEIIGDPKYAPGVWLPVEGEDYEFIKGKECVIYLKPRPHYCDRGRYLAYLDAVDDLARSIDAADLWPRFYMDHDRAKAEVEAWMKNRGQWVTS